jgi:hypothetical protein
MALTQTELEAIRKRAEAATAGPWRESKSTPSIYAKGLKHIADNVLTEDAEFIANARQDVPRLLAEVERLSYERKQYLERYVWLLEGIGKDKALDIIRKAMAEKEDE